jgi:parvulin-like peptidyl-prolyl isomerase
MVKKHIKQVFKKEHFSLKKIIILVVVLLVSISMIPWVIDGYKLSNTTSDKWVSVGNKSVKEGVFVAEYNAFIEKNYAYIRQNPFILMNFLNNLIAQQVSLLMLSNEAENIGLGADEKVILELIANVPIFKNPDGSFNREEFVKRVTWVFGSEATFLDNLKNNILRDQLIESIHPSVKQPYYVGYLDFLAIGQTREVSYIEVSKNVIPAINTTPTDEVLEQIIQNNKANFTVAETRDFEIAYFDISKKTDFLIKDTEIEEYYNSHAQEFMKPETRDVSQINFNTEQEAKEAFEKINKSGVNEVSKDFKLIKLGEIEYQDLPEELSKEIFKATEGKFYPPVQSNIGWHIFIVNKVNQPSPKALKDVRNIIKEELLVNKKSAYVSDIKNIILESLNQNLALANIAKANNAKYDSYKNIGIAESKISLNTETLDNAFKTPEGKDSGILEDQKGNYYVIKVTKVVPERIKSVQDVKPQLISIWKEQETALKISEVANNIIFEISNNKSIDKLGFKVQNSNIAMSDKASVFAKDSIETVFTSPKNKAMLVKLQNGNTAVAIIKKINIKNTAEVNKNGVRNQEVVNFNDYMNQGYIQAFLSTYIQNFEKKYKVNINEKAIIERLAPGNN